MKILLTRIPNFNQIFDNNSIPQELYKFLKIEKKLVPIIKTIILCGRQELALRGRNDSGPLDLNIVEPDHNDGNFRALLRMRISCGDKQLINHIENQSLNAMYISPSIQNNFY